MTGASVVCHTGGTMKKATKEKQKRHWLSIPVTADFLLRLERRARHDGKRPRVYAREILQCALASDDAPHA